MSTERSSNSKSVQRSPSVHQKTKGTALAELNPEQARVASWEGGACGVSAGAGTGKTRTIAATVAYLVKRGVLPRCILLVTFTRKAAQEVLRRAQSLLDARCSKVAGGTFHAFAVRVLRRYGSAIQIPNTFTILDQSDAADIMQLLRVRHGVIGNDRRFPRKDTLVDICSKSRNRCISVMKVVQEDCPQFSPDVPQMKKLFRDYEEYKTKHSVLDYDDLLSKLLELLTTQKSIARRLSNQYQYILADEYQDTNRVQAQILRALACTHDNVLVVGDELQSIFRFRGAEVKNLTEFASLFPGAVVKKLARNYRSSQQILNLANELIARSSSPYKKVLRATRPNGPRPRLVVAQDEHEQSQWVADRIQALTEDGMSLNEIAVLVRSSHLSADLERELVKRNIPYQKFGGVKFFDTAHVRDVMVHLRIVANPKDAAGWMRALRLLRGIGPQGALRIATIMVERQSHQKLAKLDPTRSDLSDLEELLGRVAPNAQNPGLALDHIVRYYQPILEKRYDDAHHRMQDLEQLVALSSRYTSIQKLLDELTLESPHQSVANTGDADPEDELLTISTIHSAKGLEWRAVFVLNVSDGALPSSRAGSRPEDLEEEERLLYVAVTRAKRRLYLSYPAFGATKGQEIYLKPSRFIEGISADVLRKIQVRSRSTNNSPMR